MEHDRERPLWQKRSIQPSSEPFSVVTVREEYLTLELALNAQLAPEVLASAKVRIAANPCYD